MCRILYSVETEWRTRITYMGCLHLPHGELVKGIFLAWERCKVQISLRPQIKIGFHCVNELKSIGYAQINQKNIGRRYLTFGTLLIATKGILNCRISLSCINPIQ